MDLDNKLILLIAKRPTHGQWANFDPRDMIGTNFIGPLDNTYQISKLYRLRFVTRRFLI